MPKYNITYPIAGCLNFCGVEAENEESAIRKCRDLVREYLDDGGKNSIDEFDGGWDMYEHINDGIVINVPCKHVEVEEVDDE